MSVEARSTLVVESGKSSQGRLEISTNPPWSVRLAWGDKEYSAEEADLFECLTTIRRSLDALGIKVCCAGARSDVYPSGMSSQMSGGRKAYIHRAGARPTMEDLVDIFDPAEPEIVVTVAEQRLAVRRRLE